MDFELEHRFAADSGTVAGALLDESYQASLGNLGPLAAREVILQEPLPDGRVLRRIRCVLGVELPRPARTILGGAKPAWIEEAVWHPDSFTWEWVIVPEMARELLRADGAIRLTDSGGTTTRAVMGRVEVKVPLYGGKVERVIVEGLESAYGEEAERLGAWLDSMTRRS